jgi:hypothetical protein
MCTPAWAAAAEATAAVLARPVSVSWTIWSTGRAKACSARRRSSTGNRCYWCSMRAQPAAMLWCCFQTCPAAHLMLWCPKMVVTPAILPMHCAQVPRCSIDVLHCWVLLLLEFAAERFLCGRCCCCCCHWVNCTVCFSQCHACSPQFCHCQSLQPAMQTKHVFCVGLCSLH